MSHIIADQCEGTLLELVAPIIADTQKKLASALEQYAFARNRTRYLVGQFMDSEGARHEQQGLYGMAAWSVLVSDLSNFIPRLAFAEHIEPLADRCYDYLILTLQQSEQPQLDPSSDAFELRYVVTKICSVYESLAKRPKFFKETNVLLARLLDCRMRDGWDFSADQKKARPISTCIVLRTIGMNGATCLTSDIICSVLDFLMTHSDKVDNTFTKLYILNTIFKCSQAYNTNHQRNALASIKEVLPAILHPSSRLPLHPTSAINVDFYDEHRTRYYRLQPDLIAIEALVILSPVDLKYVKAYPGDALLKNLRQVISTSPLEVDTYQSRLSFSTCLDLHKSLASLHRQDEENISKIRAKASALWLFGSHMTKDSCLLFLGLIMLVVAVVLRKNFLIGGSTILIATKSLELFIDYRKYKRRSA